MRKKALFSVGILSVTDEKCRIKIRIRMRKAVLRIRGSGSVPNVTDPQHRCRARTDTVRVTDGWNRIYADMKVNQYKKLRAFLMQPAAGNVD